MSKAFTKESDSEGGEHGHPAEEAAPARSVRVKNYITPGGLQRLKDEQRFLLTRERRAVTEVVAAGGVAAGHRRRRPRRPPKRPKRSRVIGRARTAPTHRGSHGARRPRALAGSSIGAVEIGEARTAPQCMFIAPQPAMAIKNAINIMNAAVI